MLNQYFKNASTIKKYERGPVGLYINRFIQWLEIRGNHRRSIRRHLRGADHFCRWAESVELAYGQLDTNALKAFGKHLKKRRLLKYASGRLNHDFIGARHFIAFLETIGDVIPTESTELEPPDPELLIAFLHWMRKQRGVMDRTVNNYRRVIVELLHSLGEDPTQYHAESLRTFVLNHTKQNGIGKAKQVVTAVRMFLRFLIAMGYCAPGLDHAIPTIADWRLSTLPKYLPAEAVEKIIISCDRTTLIGLRDQAVLLLLTRLGLRAGDVAGLELTAVDWSEGTLQVAGKNRRQTRLPLPQDAGDAVLDYLAKRPNVNNTHVFITTVAPFRPLSYRTISRIVKRAILRTGIEAPSYGAHVLRHSMATTMLRDGLPLPMISAVLRHASLETTAIYAKVDTQLLHHVARPWPEVTSC